MFSVIQMLLCSLRANFFVFIFGMKEETIDNGFIDPAENTIEIIYRKFCGIGINGTASAGVSLYRES